MLHLYIYRYQTSSSVASPPLLQGFVRMCCQHMQTFADLVLKHQDAIELVAASPSNDVTVTVVPHKMCQLMYNALQYCHEFSDPQLAPIESDWCPAKHCHSFCLEVPCLFSAMLSMAYYKYSLYKHYQQESVNNGLNFEKYMQHVHFDLVCNDPMIARLVMQQSDIWASCPHNQHTCTTWKARTVKQPAASLAITTASRIQACVASCATTMPMLLDKIDKHAQAILFSHLTWNYLCF